MKPRTLVLEGSFNCMALSPGLVENDNNVDPQELDGSPDIERRPTHITAFDTWFADWRYANRMRRVSFEVERINTARLNKMIRDHETIKSSIAQITETGKVGEYEWAKLLELVPQMDQFIEYQNLGDGIKKPLRVSPVSIKLSLGWLMEVLKTNSSHREAANLQMARNLASQSKLDREVAEKKTSLVEEFGSDFERLEHVMMELLDPKRGIPVVSGVDLACYEPAPVTMSGKMVTLYRGDWRSNPDQILAPALRDKDLTMEEVKYVRDYLLAISNNIPSFALKQLHTNGKKHGENAKADPVVSFASSRAGASGFAGSGEIVRVTIPVEWTIDIARLSRELVHREDDWDDGSPRSMTYTVARYAEGGDPTGIKDEVYVLGGFDMGEL